MNFFRNYLQSPRAKQQLKRIVLLSASLGVMTIYGFNCSKQGFVVEGMGDLSSLSKFESSEKIKPQYGISVLSAEQLLKSMTAVTGVKSIGDMANNDDKLIRETFSQRQNALPVTKDLDVISGPMMVSVANLAGAFCSKLIKEEKGNASAPSRRFFKEFDFAMGPAAISSSGFDMVVKRMGRNFWGREVTVEELDSIRATMLGEFVTNAEGTRAQPDRTSDVASGLCVTMLTAFDAVVH